MSEKKKKKEGKNYFMYVLFEVNFSFAIAFEHV
jgi:hypothetical protein